MQILSLWVLLVASVVMPAVATAQGDCRNLVDSILSSASGYDSKLKKLVSLRGECAADENYELSTARLYATNKKFDKALGLIHQRDRQGPLAHRFVLLEAKIHAITGQPQKARKILEFHLAENPRHHQLHLFRGQLLSSERNFPAAMESFIASARIKPTADAYQGAAVAQYALGDCEQAVFSVDQAVTLDESTFGDLGSMLVMSRCYARQGKFVVATNALKMLLQRNPEAEKNSDFQEALHDLRARVREAKASNDKSTDAHRVELREI